MFSGVIGVVVLAYKGVQMEVVDVYIQFILFILAPVVGTYSGRGTVVVGPDITVSGVATRKNPCGT